MMRYFAALFLFALTACSAESAAADEAAFQCNGQDAREVLHAIERSGAQLSNVREGVFYFYGEEAALSKLEVGLRDLGFDVRAARTDPGRVATINAVIDDAWLADKMPKLCKLSSDLGIEYDGWEASIPEAQRKE